MESSESSNDIKIKNIENRLLYFIDFYQDHYEDINFQKDLIKLVSKICKLKQKFKVTKESIDNGLDNGLDA